MLNKPNISRMKVYNYCIVFLIFSLSTSAFSQSGMQTFRGSIYDKQNLSPLYNAIVMVESSNTMKYTETNEKGEFSLEVPVGRCNITIILNGYYSYANNNLFVHSGKETVMEIFLEEQVNQLEEVVVKAKVDKNNPLNRMAVASARLLSTDEANRYAGSWSDPARMASNLAGVASANDSRNDIVIRGNSPIGLQWRLDGFEIANPNHFGSIGGTGGNVGMINNNQLTNSDFYTGAFPAEFGNLTSGLFDLKLRSGNSRKREYLFSLGFNGLELGAEGGFSKKSDASYLINARYSFLQSLDALGFDIAGTNGGVPKYQDVTVKLNFPMRKSNLSLLILLGASKIHFKDDMTDEEEWTKNDLGEEVDMANKQLFAGIAYTYRLSSNTRIENRVSTQSFESKQDVFTLGYMGESRDLYYISDMKDSRVSYSGKLISKLNTRNNISFGFGSDLYYSILEDHKLDTKEDIELHNCNKESVLFHSFFQWQHKFNDKLSFLPGVHMQYYSLNKDYSVEPRLGFQWKMFSSLSLGVSTGLYSQFQPLPIYFYEDEGKLVNYNVKMSRSWQSVFSIDKKISSGLRARTEIYYQYLFDIPVIPQIPEQSIINLGDDYNNKWDYYFENKGKGYNYGIEFTLEKFFEGSWYLAFTSSLYESKYKALDGILRNTKFNGNYAMNLVLGYEFKLSRRSIMSTNVKVAYIGNKRYTPSTSKNGFDIEYEYSKINSLKLPNYFRTDFNINVKTNYTHTSVEFFLEIDNLTNHKNIWRQFYNINQQKEKYTYQQMFTPMGGVRVFF